MSSIKLFILVVPMLLAIHLSACSGPADAADRAGAADHAGAADTSVNKPRTPIRFVAEG